MPSVRVVALAALAIAVSALAAAGPGTANTAPGPGAPCEDVRVVLGQGPSCPSPDGRGWLVLLSDGTSGRTHGPDRVSHFPQAEGELTTLASVRSMPVCVGDPAQEKHNLLLYTYPSDATSRLADLAPKLRDMVNQSNGILVRDAQRLDGEARYRFACDASDTITILEVQLPTDSGSDSFSTIVNDLRTLGHRSSTTKYWVWHDGSVGGGIAGQAFVHDDDRLVRTNANTYGPDYAVTYGYTGDFGAKVMMHESGHNLGAVQLSAPHSSGAWHCNDGYDIMCYSDGGSKSAYTTSACSIERFDCGNDDYFHPDPPADNYLASHWNIGSRFNPFLDFGPPPLRAPVFVSASCSPSPQLPDEDVGCSFRVEDDQPLYLVVDWGDGTSTRLPEEGTMAPGTYAPTSHRWASVGAYTINVTATDTGDPPLSSSYELQQEVGCTARYTGRVLVSLAGLAVEPYSATSRTVPPVCQGEPFTLRGGSGGDFDVCWRDPAGAAVRCDTNAGGESGLVPEGATRAQLILRSGISGNFDLRLG